MSLKQGTKRRILRLLAICLGIGLISPSAGSALGMDFATSVIFGALMTGISIASIMLITFAVKDGVTDQEFNRILKDAAEQAQTKQKKD